MKNKITKLCFILSLILLSGCGSTEQEEVKQKYDCHYLYNDENNVETFISLTTKGSNVLTYRKTDKLNITSANYPEEELEEVKNSIVESVYSLSAGKGITVDAEVIKDDKNVYIEYYIEADLTIANIKLLRYSNLIDEYNVEDNTLTIDNLKPFFEENNYICELIEK